MKALVVGGVQEVVLRVLAGDVDQPVLCDDAPTGGLPVVCGTALVARFILRTAAGGVIVNAGVLWEEEAETTTTQ